MADNVGIDTGTDADVAADQRPDGSYVQLNKLLQGDDGVFDPVDAANPLPVLLDNPTANPETGLAKEVTLAAVKMVLDAIEANTDGLELSLTDVNLNTDQLEVSLSNIFAELGQKLEAGDVTGLATSARQDVLLTEVQQKVEAADLVALSTAAKQDTIITALGSLLTELGQKVETGDANGIDVDVTRLPVGPTTSTLTNVTSSDTNVTLLSANTARKQATFYNDTDSGLYLKLGTTASATSFTVYIAPGQFYELPFSPHGVYTGRIDGIWTAGPTGDARITEIS